MSKNHRQREARKRQEKRQEKNKAVLPERIDTVTMPSHIHGRSVVIGRVDGRVVYRTKPLLPTYLGVRKQRWVRRMTKRLASKKGVP